MPMKLHQAKDMGHQFYLQVWLDDTRFELDADGNPTAEPDPEWLREYRWGKDVDRRNIRLETRLLARLELAKMNAVVVTLPGEGWYL